ncbi:hydrogenase maturation nickel metallochaperone HypA [bacterium]|nr:hydrogenase maturation nickel metallochaperone HypA [candidate division CSSED10-310 bacterium]
MHELGITRELLDIALEEADKGGLVSIKVISVVIGRLTGFVPDSIRYYFEIFSENTVAAGADLRFDERPAGFSCRGCGLEFTIDEPVFLCPGCGGHDLTLLSGKEFYLDYIEGNEASQPYG